MEIKFILPSWLPWPLGSISTGGTRLALPWPFTSPASQGQAWFTFIPRAMEILPPTPITPSIFPPLPFEPPLWLNVCPCFKKGRADSQDVASVLLSSLWVINTIYSSWMNEQQETWTHARMPNVTDTKKSQPVSPEWCHRRQAYEQAAIIQEDNYCHGTEWASWNCGRRVWKASPVRKHLIKILKDEWVFVRQQGRWSDVADGRASYRGFAPKETWKSPKISFCLNRKTKNQG